MPPPQALAIARQKGLDLVEISPTAVPPVCRIMDYGKYQYQEQKRARSQAASARGRSRRDQVPTEGRRARLHVQEEPHSAVHRGRRQSKGDDFLRGREMAHPEIGHKILMWPHRRPADVAVPETQPRMEGNQMHTILTAKKGAKPTKSAPAATLRPAGSGNEMKMKLKHASWRCQAIQEDRHRQVQAWPVVQAAHPHEQDDQVGSADCVRPSSWQSPISQARADAAV